MPYFRSFAAFFHAGEALLPALLGQAAGNGGAGGAGGGFESIFGSMMIPMLLTLALMYFLMMAPEKKKRKELERLLAALKKNDHVVTIGGLCGTVVSAATNSKYITIRIDDGNGTKVKLLRSAVSFVGGPDEAEAEGKTGD